MKTKKTKTSNQTDLQLNPVRLIELELSESFSPALSYIEEKIFEIRQEIADKFGFIPPAVPVFTNKNFKKGKYIIKLEDLDVVNRFMMPGLLLASGPASFIESLKGLDGAAPDGQKGKWISPSDSEEASKQGCRVYEPEEIIIEELKIIIFKNVHRLLGLEESRKLLDDLKASHPVLVEELVPQVFSLLEIRRILKRLLIEKVSLRPLISILESLADYCHITKDSDRLTEYVRQSLGSYICKDYTDESGTISVMIADSRMERIFLKGVIKDEEGTSLELDPEIRKNLRESIGENSEKLEIMGLKPVLLTSPETRLHLKRFSERSFPDLVILSLDEIPPHIKTNSLAIVSVEDANAYIESGDQYYRENRLDLAEAEYTRAVELDPTNARAHYALRLTYRKMGKLEMALNSYRKAIELDPKYEFIDLELEDGEEELIEEIKEELSERDRASEETGETKALEEILIINPKKKKKKKAPPVPSEETVYIDRERIEKMKKLNPSFATIFNKMGEEHLGTDNYEAATKEFKKAIELDPNYPEPHFNLGKVYFLQKDWFLCRKEFEKAIELNPDYLRAYFYLGKLFKQRNMKDKAEQAFYRAWELATKNSDMDFREVLKKELEQLKSNNP